MTRRRLVGCSSASAYHAGRKTVLFSWDSLGGREAKGPGSGSPGRGGGGKRTVSSYGAMAKFKSVVNLTPDATLKPTSWRAYSGKLSRLNSYVPTEKPAWSLPTEI